MTFEALRLVQFSSDASNTAIGGTSGVLPQEERSHLSQGARFDDLYDELRPSLYSYLVCMGLSATEADDVIQDAFVDLLRFTISGGVVKNPRGCVFRASHNRAINFQKRERRLVSDTGPTPPARAEGREAQRSSADPALNPEERVLWKEQLRRLDAAVFQLTERQRRCLHLRAEGLRYREIAEVLGITTASVAELLERAVSRLMEQVYE